MSSTDIIEVSGEWSTSERTAACERLKDETERLLSVLAEIRGNPAKEMSYSHTHIRLLEVLTFRNNLMSASVEYLSANYPAFRGFICIKAQDRRPVLTLVVEDSHHHLPELAPVSEEKRSTG